MTPEKFSTLASQNYSLVPVTREVLADLETPLSCYLKLARGAYSYLFESVQGGEKWGRYSLIGLPSRTILKVFGDQLVIEKNHKITESKTTIDPLSDIEQFQARYQIPDLPELPRFTGGLVGYFGYDVVRYVEDRLSKLEEQSHEPQNYREECERMNKELKNLKLQIKKLKRLK